MKRSAYWLVCVFVVLLDSTLFAQQPQITSSTTGQITAEMIGRKYSAMKLNIATVDANYGYSEKLPIQVGGGLGEGSQNTYRYLNALLGPKSEVVRYDRVGTCCEFKTKNSPFGDSALLEVFEIRFNGGEPKRLYFNWYDSGELLIPVGLTAR